MIIHFGNVTITFEMCIMHSPVFTKPLWTKINALYMKFTIIEIITVLVQV